MFDHNIFQDNLVGVDFCEQMVKETNPGVWDKAQKTRRPARQHPRLPHHRRHHDGAQPVHRRVLPRSAADEPADARDVLPDGRPARPPLDALPRRRRHRADAAALHRLPRPADEVRRVHEEGRAAARRPVRLLLRGPARLRGGRPAPRPARLLGLVQRPRGLRLPVPAHERVGQGDVRHARRHRRRQGGHATTWWTSTSASASCSAARSTTTGRTGETFVKHDPLGNPVDQRHPVEPDDDAAGRRSATSTASTPGSCRRAGTTSGPATTWRSTPAAGRSPGSGPRPWPGWWTSATSRRPATASRSTCPRPRCCRRSSSSGRSRSGATPSSATGPAPTSRPTRRPRRCTSPSRR